MNAAKILPAPTFKLTPRAWELAASIAQTETNTRKLRRQVDAGAFAGHPQAPAVLALLEASEGRVRAMQTELSRELQSLNVRTA